MEVNSISTTNFSGKALFLSGLKKNEKAYAKQILDFKFDGITNSELLAEKNFDIKFFDAKENKSCDTLYLSTDINYLVKQGQKVLGFSDKQLHEIDIKSGVEGGAIQLRKVIEKINGDIAKRYPTQYNTKQQKAALEETIKGL